MKKLFYVKFLTIYYLLKFWFYSQLQILSYLSIVIMSLFFFSFTIRYGSVLHLREGWERHPFMAGFAIKDTAYSLTQRDTP